VTISDYWQLVQEAAGIRSHEIKIPGWFLKLIDPLAEFFYKITRTRPRITRLCHRNPAKQFKNHLS